LRAAAADCLSELAVGKDRVTKAGEVNAKRFMHLLPLLTRHLGDEEDLIIRRRSTMASGSSDEGHSSDGCGADGGMR
jgi:hypothetical protein